MIDPYPATMSELIEAHRRALAKVDAAEDGDEVVFRKIALEQALSALRAAIVLFNSSEQYRSEGLARVFAPLANAVHDTISGARPPLVFEQSGRPVDLTQDYVRAGLAMGLDLLLAPYGCMGKRAAADWLAGECAKGRVKTEDGGLIDAGQLERWRRDAKSGAASRASRAQFDALQQSYRDRGILRKIQTLALPDRVATAQIYAGNIVKLLGTHAPRSAPTRRKPGL